MSFTRSGGAPPPWYTIFTGTLGDHPSNFYADLTEYDIVAYPGDIVVLVVAINGSGLTGDAGVGITWSEDI
jgi:hypothetical protein